jgi:hypothetical protein
MGDEPDTPDILYHYCSNATFLSIIESNTIRLSDLSLSNDSQEGRWGRQDRSLPLSSTSPRGTIAR